MPQHRYSHLLILVWRDDAGSHFRAFRTPGALANEAKQYGATVQACKSPAEASAVAKNHGDLYATLGPALQHLEHYQVIYAVDGLKERPARWLTAGDLLGGAVRASGAPLPDAGVELTAIACAHSAERAGCPWSFAYDEADLQALAGDDRWAPLVPGIRREVARTRGLYLHRRSEHDPKDQVVTIDPSWHDADLPCTYELKPAKAGAEAEAPAATMAGGGDDHRRTGVEAGALEDPMISWLKSALVLHQCTDARVLASRITGLAAAAEYLSLLLPDAWTPREPYEVTFSNPNNRLLDLRAYIEVIGEVFGPRARIAQKVALDLPLTALELIQREFFTESMRSDRDRASAIGRLANVAESTARSTLLKRGPTSFDRLLYMAEVMGYEFVLKKRDPDAPQA